VSLKEAAMEDEKREALYAREDEIDLYELFLVLRKRYKLIAAVFMISVAAAAVLSFLLPPVYRVSAFLSPGWLSVSEQGSITYIDTSDNIAYLVENGGYTMQVIEALGLAPEKYAEKLEFEANHPKNSNIVQITHDTDDAEFGRRVMEELLGLLKEFYRERLDIRREAKDKEVEILRNKITTTGNLKSLILNEKKKLSSNIKLEKNRLSLLKNTENTLIKQLENVEKNTKIIMEQRAGMLDQDKDAKDAVSLLLYSNTIQQNISYIDRLNSELDKNRLEQDSARNSLEKFKLSLKDKDIELRNKDTEILDIEQKIKVLKLEKQKMEGVRIVQEPTVNPVPVRPRKLVNVAVAGVGSFFIGVFLAFFMEWAGRNRETNKN
jgi:capsular polysaccharide biosynthesis protein